MKHLKTYENNEYDKDITFDWKYFKNFVDTYDPKIHGDQNWHIILLDMLYGLGVSLDKNEFKGADGFRKFREYLKTDVNWKIKKDSDKYNL